MDRIDYLLQYLDKLSLLFERTGGGNVIQQRIKTTCEEIEKLLKLNNVEKAS